MAGVHPVAAPVRSDLALHLVGRLEEVPEGIAIDPATGLPAVGTDPATGAPVVVYDPTTGLPITGYDANGRPITLQPGGGAGATSDSTGVEAGP